MLPIVYLPLSKIRHRLGFAFYAGVALFGINGWFKLFVPNEFIETVSILSGIMLGIWVATAPLFYLVHKVNEKKRRGVSEL